MKKIVAIGPFIGSFEEEIFTFRPFVAWITRNLKYTDLYLSVYENRRFLYPNVPANKIVFIDKELSKKETRQSGYIHLDVSQIDFTTMIKNFKAEVSDRSKASKKDIDIYSLPYVKHKAPIPLHQKIFEVYPAIKKQADYYVFIPDSSIKNDIAIKVYDFLSNKIPLKVVGDMKSCIPEANQLYKNSNHFRSIVNEISNCRAVITPCSHWTLIANRQRKSVFSWGENVGMFRENGIYNFDNKCTIMYYDDESSITSLLGSINKFINI